MKDFKNILRGDYPDPCTMRFGDTYYLVCSSFQYCPALTIWQSKDLRNWEPLCHAIDDYIGDVLAPDICYHDGKFYIYYYANAKEGNCNYVTCADKIEGPWSKPVPIKIPGIDPGHIVDENGDRYLFVSSGLMCKLTDDGLALDGEPVKVYDGWEIPDEWEIECFGLEAPKLFRKNGYFYMITAEGGTAGPATSHMVIAARAKSLKGPWENAPNNPIIHTESSEEKWWSQGHGTMFDTPEGDWYIIYHGYEKGYNALGRQSLISKLIWTDDGWFHLQEIENFDQIDEEKQVFLDLNDDFKSDKLDWKWRFFGSYDMDRLKFTDSGLIFKGKGNDISETTPLLVNPYSHSYTASVCVELENTDTQAGVLIYYNDKAYAAIGTDSQSIWHGSMAKPAQIKLDKAHKKVYLKLLNNKQMLTVFYSLDGENWTKIRLTRDVSGFNHNIFAGFYSLKVGIYSLGNGEAKFTDFKYTHID